MPEPTRYPPNDPREWLTRARSDLALARAHPEGVLLEDLCFHAQQAAEKTIKAALVQHEIEFPTFTIWGRCFGLSSRQERGCRPTFDPLSA